VPAERGIGRIEPKQGALATRIDVGWQDAQQLIKAWNRLPGAIELKGGEPKLAPVPYAENGAGLVRTAGDLPGRGMVKIARQAAADRIAIEQTLWICEPRS